MNSFYQKVEKLIERISEEEYAVVVHRHADPDAVGSASAFKLFGKPKFYAPGGLSALGKRVAQHANVTFLEETPREKVIVVLDTASSSQLPNVELKDKEVYRIDHHVSGDIEPYILDTTATSTSEIVTEMLMVLGAEPSSEISEALMSGIIYDSKGLRMATARTFRIMNFLAERGSVRKAFSLLESEGEEDFSKRMARVKACERLVYRRVKEFIIGVTRVGANESDVARSLISLGLDVIYVIREEKGETRIYARCSPRVLKIGFNVSEVLSSIAELYGGKGGGHPGAGGAVIPKEVEFQELSNKLLGRTSRRIAELLR